MKTKNNRINETNGWYFEMINEMAKPLARLTKTKGDKIYFPYHK